MSVDLKRRQQDVHHPHADEEHEGDPLPQDRSTQLGLAQEPDVPPGHEDHDAQDGGDGVQRDAEAQVSGLHLKFVALEKNKESCQLVSAVAESSRATQKASGKNENQKILGSIHRSDKIRG